MSQPFRTEAIRQYVIRHNDPKEYGAVCPCCNKRYGSPQRRGFIDVRRCSSCPSQMKQEQRMQNKRAKE